MITGKHSLSNLQQQLLKLYAADIPDNKLREVSDIIANYLLKEARNEADKAWTEKKYSEQQLNEWLNKQGK
jgi:hypothetical protein